VTINKFQEIFYANHNNKQHKTFLVFLKNMLRCNGSCHIYNWCKENWAYQCNILRTIQVLLHNTNGFRTETMYDYYIAMKSMLLVVKLFSHSSIDYVSLTILLPWTTQTTPKTIQNQKLLKIQNFHTHKLGIHNITLVQMKVSFKVTKHLLIY